MTDVKQLIDGRVTDFITVETLYIEKTGEEKHLLSQVVNWQDVEVELVRSDTSGTVYDDGQEIEFCFWARKKLLALFEEDGLNAKARYRVYKRGPRYFHDYEMIKDLELDFSTFSDDDSRGVLTMSGKNAEFADLVQSNQSTNYDILVSDVAEPKQWKYGRMNLMCTGEYTLLTDVVSLHLSARKSRALSMYLSGSEQIPGSPEHDIKSQQASMGGDVHGGDYSGYFFEAAENVESVTISIEIDMEITMFADIDSNPGIPSSEINQLMGFFVAKKGESPKFDYSKPYFGRETGHSEFTFGGWPRTITNISEIVDVTINGGERLIFGIYMPTGGHIWQYQLTRFNKFELLYFESGQEQFIDVIRPEKLIQKFLDVMTSKENYMTCSIDWGDLPYTPMLVAAESIRGFDEAYIHNTLAKVLEWMKFMGYEYYYNRTTRELTFKHRDEFFTREKALSLKAKEVGSFVREVDIEQVYTAVKIDYPDGNNESINGRFTFCVPTDYKTEYNNTEAKQLDCKTNFIADPITLELLCWKRGQSTTDNRNDNNIFVVAMSEGPEYWTEDKNLQFVINKDIKLFNACLHPYYIAKQNESRIGMSGEVLKFTGTEGFRDGYITRGNSQVKINPYSDIRIRKKLFSPMVYKFNVGYLGPILEEQYKDGLIYFPWKGGIYKGYIKSIISNPSREKAQDWEVYAATFPEGVYAVVDPEITIQSDGLMAGDYFIDSSGLEVVSAPDWMKFPYVGQIIPSGARYIPVECYENLEENRNGLISFVSPDDRAQGFATSVTQLRKPGIPVTPDVVLNAASGNYTFDVEYDEAWAIQLESGPAQIVGPSTGEGNGTFTIWVPVNIRDTAVHVYVRVYPVADPLAYTRVLIVLPRAIIV